MKRFALMFMVCAVVASPVSSFAQARRVAPTTAATPPAASRPAPDAAALFEEADDYAQNKFREFQQKNVPYSTKLYEQTLQEQQRLAALNATKLNARKDLAGDDLYYLGRLYALASDEESAIDALKRFLAGVPSGERAQSARYHIFLLAAKAQQFAEGEGALADYIAGEPQKTTERVILERSLAVAYRKDKQLDHAATHAEESFKRAKEAFQQGANDTAHAETFYSGIELATVYLESQQKV